MSEQTRRAHFALEVVRLVYGLSCSGVVHLQHVIPVLKLGLEHLRERSQEALHCVLMVHETRKLHKAFNQREST